MNAKTLVLRIQLDKPDDNVRSMFIELPAGYGDINVDRPNQRAVLNGICQGFGILLGCPGARLLEAALTDVPSVYKPDDCDECRVSGLLEE